MISKEKQVQLAKYRLNQFEECIDETSCLFPGKKGLLSIKNEYTGKMNHSLSFWIKSNLSASRKR